MLAPARPQQLVVAALITRTTGEILLTQRREDQTLPLYWEFPGGKIELGEAPEQALRRELQEEIGVELIIDGIWDVIFHAYPDFYVYMLVYRCQLAPAAIPINREVRDLAWVHPSQLKNYAILPADLPLCERLTQ